MRRRLTNLEILEAKAVLAIFSRRSRGTSVWDPSCMTMVGKRV